MMIDTFIDPISEVRHNRELLLEKHGGIKGLHKHMDKERPRLEKQGWKFVSVEEVKAKKHNRTANAKLIRS